MAKRKQGNKDYVFLFPDNIISHFILCLSFSKLDNPFSPSQVRNIILVLDVILDLHFRNFGSEKQSRESAPPWKTRAKVRCLFICTRNSS